MSWLSLWRPSETRSLMNQAQQTLRIHSLNAQESHEKELSYKSSTVSCCGGNTQPENCSWVLVAAPAWAAWSLPWAKPWWGCRTRVKFSGQENMVEWLGGGTAAFSMVLCGCLSTHSTSIPAASAVQGILPAPGLCLPSWVHVQKTLVQENIQSWPWMFVVGRLKQSPMKQSCSGWPLEFHF